MPFRHAHRALLLLFPLILLAFWPGYFGMLRDAPFALHAHGITASCWLMLVTAQSWSIHARRASLHRSLGLATFVIVPLFAAAGLLAIRGGVALAQMRSDPFHSAYGVPLALVDLASLMTFLILVGTALAARRRLWTHGGAMLATVFLVLPPILGRLLPIVPGFPRDGAILPTFALSFQVAQVLTALGALAMAQRYRRAAPPFLLVVATLAFECLAFATFANGAAWQTAAYAALAIPTWLLAAAGILVGAGVVAFAWRRPPRAHMPAAVTA